MSEAEIKTPYLRRAGLTLFRPAEAVAALSELEMAGAVLLGADRFELVDDDSVRPSGILDLSPGGRDAASYADVRVFVESDLGRPNIAFELVWS